MIECSLREIFNTRYIKKDNLVASVWNISSPYLNFYNEFTISRKKFLLYLISSFPMPILVYDEIPVKQNLKACLQKVSCSIWIIKNTDSLDDLYEWLGMGNWHIYQSDDPYLQFNLYDREIKLDKVFHIMQGKKIPYLLDAFYDNIEWRIMINPEF